MPPDPRPSSSPQSSQSVAVADLADELQTYKQTIFKIAKRLAIEPFKRRDATRGNQLIALVTESEAIAIRDAFSEGRRTGDAADSGDFAPNEGVFYLIELEPKCDPGRFKVGFTTDLDGRIRHHRCSAPFAAYKKTWPCRRTWERAAIDSMTDGLEQLHTEVFRASSLDDVVKRGDRFFGVMPTVQVVSDPEDTPDEPESATEPQAG